VCANREAGGMRLIAACAVVSIFLSGVASAATATKAYVTTTRMQNLIEANGVSFSGFAHLNGYRVRVDVSRCLGLRRLGARSVGGTTMFSGFKCRITTDDESVYTLWLHATTQTHFSIDSAALVSSSSPRVENCVNSGGDWAACVGQYRP
jgi:hypothetical protein